MFVIRQAIPDDVELFLKLAKMVHFINLPPDGDIILDKVRWSRKCFERVRAGEGDLDSAQMQDLKHLGGAAGKSPQYMFALEDPDTGRAVGNSALISQMGSVESPNLYFRLSRREFFSEDLQSGFTHVLATLTLDTSGPSEIGGLILSPSLRGHPQKLGKLLSLVRFHYAGLHRDRVQDRFIAELMAPISASGDNPFWEAVGRRFINLTYTQADQFCARSREFMISLLPKEPIYLTLLPTEARRVVGAVGHDTVPARRMLEKIGFTHTDLVDPFDAGPILEARTDEIPLVAQTRRLPAQRLASESGATHQAIVSSDQADEGGFRAVMVPAELTGDGVRVSPEALEALRVDAGAEVGVTPMKPLAQSVTETKEQFPTRAEGDA
jgi:arginine N-succinyltransferase